MAMNRAQLLREIAKASTVSGGNNLRDGRGRLAIKRLALEDGFKGTRFTADFVVVGSQKIPVMGIKAEKTLDVEPNPPSSEVGWIQIFNDKHLSSHGAVKTFVLALFGEAEAEVSDDDFIDTLDELVTKNSAHGMVIDYETYRKVTRENEIEIVLPKWFHVEQTSEDAAKTRAWMESLTLGAASTPVAASAANA